MLKKFLRLEELYEKIEKLQDNILILRREIKELEARIDKQDEFLRSVKGVIKNDARFLIIIKTRMVTWLSR